MKRNITCTMILLLTFIFFGCAHQCVQCDIYDEYGYYVKDYGEYCGEWYMVSDYEDDAQYHAEHYYSGWAECY